MDPSWLGVVIASLGSTGVAGLIASGVNVSRSVRLRKSIAQSLKIAASFEEGSPSRQAVQLAADRDALSLASISLVQHPTSIRSIVVLAIGFLLLSVGLLVTTPSAPQDSAPEPTLGVWQIAAFLVGYVIALVAALDFLVRWRRDALVKAILLSGEVDVRWNGATWPRQRLVEREYYIQLEAERKRVNAELKKLPRR